MQSIVKFINDYKDTPRHIYKWLMDFIGYIVGTTSDQAADIAARSLPLVAPLPNAISVYFVSQSALGFNQYQALAFACAIEIAMFAVIEIALIMFDGLLKDERRYKGAFKLSLGVSVGVLILIILFVVFVEITHENGNPILAGMPLLSGASAIMLALKRWHSRNENEEQNAHADAIAKLNNEIDRLSNELSVSVKENATYANNITSLTLEINRKDSDLINLTSEIDLVKHNMERAIESAVYEKDRAIEVSKQTNDLAIEHTKREVDRLSDKVKTLTSELIKKDETIAELTMANRVNGSLSNSQSEQIERLNNMFRDEQNRRSADAGKYEEEIDALSGSNRDLQMQIEKNKSEITELRIALARSEEQVKAAQKSANVVRPNVKPEPKSNSKIGKHDAFRLIVDHCENNPFATLAELQVLTGKGKSTVSEYLTEMENSNIIHRNGNGIEILNRP